MFAGERPPVATWYSRGWKRWKLRRSTSVTSTGASFSPRATASPPKPPPTITTFIQSLCIVHRAVCIGPGALCSMHYALCTSPLLTLDPLTLDPSRHERTYRTRLCSLPLLRPRRVLALDRCDRGLAGGLD